MAVDLCEFSENLPVDSFGYYVSMLGMKEKRLPEVREMPENFFLSPDITKTLWDALSVTRKTGREVLFTLDVSGGLIKPSKYCMGTENSVSFLNPFRFKRKLAEIHTHPLHNSPGFSDVDMAIFFSEPNSGYLFMTVSEGGISALARTQETAKIPFSSNIKTRQELKKMRNRSLVGVDLTKRGYVYYCWENTSRTFHQQGKDGSGYNITNPMEYGQIASGVTMVRKILKFHT